MKVSSEKMTQVEAAFRSNTFKRLIALTCALSVSLSFNAQGKTFHNSSADRQVSFSEALKISLGDPSVEEELQRSKPYQNLKLKITRFEARSSELKAELEASLEKYGVSRAEFESLRLSCTEWQLVVQEFETQAFLRLFPNGIYCDHSAWVWWPREWCTRDWTTAPNLPSALTRQYKNRSDAVSRATLDQLFSDYRSQHNEDPSFSSIFNENQRTALRNLTDRRHRISEQIEELKADYIETSPQVQSLKGEARRLRERMQEIWADLPAGSRCERGIGSLSFGLESAFCEWKGFGGSGPGLTACNEIKPWELNGSISWLLAMNDMTGAGLLRHSLSKAELRAELEQRVSKAIDEGNAVSRKDLYSDLIEVIETSERLYNLQPVTVAETISEGSVENTGSVGVTNVTPEETTEEFAGTTDNEKTAGGIWGWLRSWFDRESSAEPEFASSLGSDEPSAESVSNSEDEELRGAEKSLEEQKRLLIESHLDPLWARLESLSDAYRPFLETWIPVDSACNELSSLQRGLRDNEQQVETVESTLSVNFNLNYSGKLPVGVSQEKQQLEEDLELENQRLSNYDTARESLFSCREFQDQKKGDRNKHSADIVNLRLAIDRLSEDMLKAQNQQKDFKAKAESLVSQKQELIALVKSEHQLETYTVAEKAMRVIINEHQLGWAPTESFVGEMPRLDFPAGAKDFFTLKADFDRLNSASPIRPLALMYNRDFPNMFSPPFDGRIQCYSGSILYFAHAMSTLFTDQEKNLLQTVAIFTPGHVLPGFIEIEQGTQVLYGVETTALGPAKVKYGEVQNISGDIRIVSLAQFLVVEALKHELQHVFPVVTSTLERIAELGFDTEALKAYDPNKTFAEFSLLNSTPFGFGRAAVDEGDSSLDVFESRDKSHIFGVPADQRSLLDKALPDWDVNYRRRKRIEECMRLNSLRAEKESNTDCMLDEL